MRRFDRTDGLWELARRPLGVDDLVWWHVNGGHRDVPSPAEGVDVRRKGWTIEAVAAGRVVAVTERGLMVQREVSRSADVFVPLSLRPLEEWVSEHRWLWWRLSGDSSSAAEFMRSQEGVVASIEWVNGSARSRGTPRLRVGCDNGRSEAMVGLDAVRWLGPPVRST